MLTRSLTRIGSLALVALTSCLSSNSPGGRNGSAGGATELQATSDSVLAQLRSRHQFKTFADPANPLGEMHVQLLPRGGATSLAVSDGVIRADFGPAHTSATVDINSRQVGVFRISGASNQVELSVMLRDTRPANPVTEDGYVIFPGAYGSGADLLHRVHADGIEDFIAFSSAPAEEAIQYDVSLGSSIAGLRLVENTLEFLDVGGTPRLRVAPPFIIDSTGAAHDAHLTVEGCAADTSPLAPWGRPVVVPGASSCAVRVSWAGQGVTYPALLDPSWSTTGSMITDRSAHQMVTLANGKVLVAGGISTVTGSTMNKAELYDPSTQTWAATGAIPAPVDYAVSALLKTGKVLLAGGWNEASKSIGWGLNSAYLYDPSTGTWTTTGTMGDRRSNAAGVLLNDGRFLIAGGNGYPGHYGFGQLSSAEIYDPNAGTWSRTGSLYYSRYYHSMVLLQNGKALAFGGGNDSYVIATAELFDPSTGTWSTVGAMTSPRRWPAAAVLQDGRVLVAGGATQLSPLKVTATADLFNPATSTWSAAASMSTARYQAPGQLLPDGTVIVSGGNGAGNPAALAGSEVYAPSSNTWSATAPLNTARYAHTVVPLPSGQALLAGGIGTQNQSLTSSELLILGKANGAACSTTSDCTSGFCVNGVCCNTACSGGCGVCAAALGAIADGVCSPAPAGSGGSPSCSPYVCDGTDMTCPTSCASSSVCIAPDVCSQGQCVADTVPPVITTPGSLTASATGASGAQVAFTVSATDNHDGTVAVTCTPASGAWFAIGTTTVSCTASDKAGNVATASFTVSIADTTPPTISNAPSSISAAATSAAGATVSYALPAAQDAVDGSVPVSCAPASGSVFPLGSTQVTCTAADHAGNTASAGFTVQVHDTVAPVLSLPGSVLAEATSASGAAVPFSVGAVDNVDPHPVVTCAPASGSTFALGTTPVTCTATDASGNSSTGSFTVTVRDMTPPVISGSPGNVVAEATGPQGADVSWDSLTATDTVDGPVAVSCSPASGTLFALGGSLVTCSAADAHGNQSSISFQVTVVDSTPPTLSLPSDQVLEATGPGGAALDYQTSATDLVDGSVTVSCTPASGSLFALGSTTVTCNATDSHGNSATGSFSVTVRDTTPPVFSVPASVTAEATSENGAAVTFTTTAMDLVDGLVLTTCVPASGSTFPLGSTDVTCTASDTHGNASQATFSVLVQDTTPPALANVPDSLTAEATSANGATVSWPDPTALDAVDGAVPVTCTPASGSTFPLGATTVSCDAKDAHNNVSQKSFTVTVQDTTPPALQVPGSTVAEATSAAGAAVLFNVSALDLVDGTVSASCSPASGSTFALGTTTVTCTAADSHGNTGSASFAVTVKDTTPPALSNIPGNLTAEATSASGAAVSWTPPSAADLVDGAVAVTCTPAAGSTFALGATTVACGAVDAHGNRSSQSFTVTVQDTMPPVLSNVPSNLVAEATGSTGAVVTWASPSALDTVDGAVAATCLPSSGSTFPLGGTPVTCSSKDAHGNTASQSFVVTVRDTTPPTVQVPAPTTAEATSAAGATVSFTASALDLVDGAVAPSCTPASGSTFALGTTTVTCTASDSHGNSASAQFPVTVQDTTAPVLANVPGNLTAMATSHHGAMVTWASPSATDAVDGAVAVACVPAPGSTFAIGTTNVTCSAADAHGNSASQSFSVTVEAKTPPVVHVPPSTAATASSSTGAVVTYSASAQDFAGVSVATTCTKASGSKFDLGLTTVTCSATDFLGNTGTASFPVNVTYDWTGFLAPVQDGATFHMNSTINVRFKLVGASSAVTNANARLYVARILGSNVGAEMPAASSDQRDGNRFEFVGHFDGDQDRDDRNARYQFQLSTRNLSPGAWQLRVDLGDGAQDIVRIVLR